MTGRQTDDPATGTDLTDQQATDLNAKEGRGARQEPGARMDDQEIERHIERDSSTDLLDPEDGPRETRNPD